MATPRYTRERTALLLVDPYKDFLSEGGKLWPYVRDVAQSVGLHDNLRAILGAVRKAGIRVFIVPHHRAEPGDPNLAIARVSEASSGPAAPELLRCERVGPRLALQG